MDLLQNLDKTYGVNSISMSKYNVIILSKSLKVFNFKLAPDGSCIYLKFHLLRNHTTLAQFKRND